MRNGTILDVDVLVIGGGPAGSACAIQLARSGARVAIVEASDFSRFRIGETIEPSVRPLFAKLGIEVGADCRWSAASTGVVAAWGQLSATQRPSILNPYDQGWRVDRKAFDHMLFDRARHAGALAFTQSRPTSGTRRSGAWAFTLDTPASPICGRTRWIVAATGRSASAPFAPCRKRLWLDRLVGIALIAESGEPPRSNIPAAAFVEAAPCGWWYAATIPNGGKVAVFFTDSDLLPLGKHKLAEFLFDQLARSPLIRAGREFVEERIGLRQWTGFDARSSIRRTAIADGWVAVGDALTAFAPLCGRGTTEALSAQVRPGSCRLARAVRPYENREIADLGRQCCRTVQQLLYPTSSHIQRRETMGRHGLLAKAWGTRLVNRHRSGRWIQARGLQV
jgi:flavin-dependent dehydrogenase